MVGKILKLEWALPISITNQSITVKLPSHYYCGIISAADGMFRHITFPQLEVASRIPAGTC
jgi:hypothetical protein